MQTRRAFHLWPRLHQELIRFLELVPKGDLSASAPGFALSLGELFCHIAEVETYWRKVVLERSAEYEREDPKRFPDIAALRAHLEEVFTAIEHLLDASLIEALVERAVETSYPAKNGLEALTLCHVHTVHHRAQIEAQLSALGVDTGDWL